MCMLKPPITSSSRSRATFSQPPNPHGVAQRAQLWEAGGEVAETPVMEAELAAGHRGEGADAVPAGLEQVVGGIEGLARGPGSGGLDELGEAERGFGEAEGELLGRSSHPAVQCTRWRRRGSKKSAAVILGSARDIATKEAALHVDDGPSTQSNLKLAAPASGGKPAA